MSKGAFSYLDGSIKRLSALPADRASFTKTSWDSETPYPKEWRAYGAWTLGLLLINTKNPTGLEINMDGTAAKAWTLYINTYEKASNMV